MKKTIIIYYILLTSFLIAQTKKTSTLNLFDKKNTKKVLNNHYPKFDLHLGVGAISGATIGFRAMPIGEISLEFKYGLDWRNLLFFIAASDIHHQMTVGINWHFQQKENLALSLLATSDGVYVFLSPNVSFINFNSEGFNFFGRVGLAFKIYTVVTKKYSFVHHSPNIEFGVSYCFPKAN